MDIFILVLELIGAAAFAVSGAMTGIRKNMDIFGAFVLALTVAVGGGIIRDIILGAFPPAMFQNPIYALTAFLTCLIVFIPQVRDLLERSSRVMLLADSIGLGIFTVSGAMRAFEVSENPTVFLAVFVGVITGVGGRSSPRCDGRRHAIYIRTPHLRDRLYRRRPAVLHPHALHQRLCRDAFGRGSHRSDPPARFALQVEPAKTRQPRRRPLACAGVLFGPRVCRLPVHKMSVFSIFLPFEPKR